MSSSNLKKCILRTGVIIGLTFSYSIFYTLLPEICLQRTAVKMTVWTFAMLISYSIYTLATIHIPVPASAHWTIHSKWSVLIPMLVLVLMGLAILFPSPKHDRLDMLYIVFIAVIGEEVLFRGLLWDLIAGWVGHTPFLHLSGTIWLSAFAFGVMHLQYHQFQIHLASIFQTSYSFAFGIILGAIRLRTQSIVPPIFAHSAFNSIFNLLLVVLQFFR